MVFPAQSQRIHCVWTVTQRNTPTETPTVCNPAPDLLCYFSLPGTPLLQHYCQSRREAPSTSGLSAVFSGSGQSPCGLWISDSAGNDFEDEFVPGFEVDLPTRPIQFDAKVPHCGRTSFKAGSYATRVSIAAFQLRRRTPPCMTTCDTLGSLGFSIPEASALVPQTLEQQEPPKADQP